METNTYINVVQDSEPLDRGEVDENFIQLKFSFYKYIGVRPTPQSPVLWDSRTCVAVTSFLMDFPAIKRIPSSYRSMCTRSLSDYLSTMNVPEDKLPLAIQMLFDRVDETVSPDYSINLEIFDVTLHHDRSTILTATREASSEGLERVRLDRLGVEGDGETCAICWLAYADEVTQLPCSHYFHEDCIVRWLQINRICPLCRFALPTQPSQPSA